jgi:hypothetical protein
MAVRATASRIETASLGSPANASATGVHAAVTDTGAPSVVTTAITNPTTPRNITVTAGGTAADIKPIKVKVEGKDASGAAISEEIGPFTENTAGTVEGKKAFASVSKITIPAHDGTGATTAVGFGNVLGLGFELSRNTILNSFLNGVRETTDPTVTISTSVLSENTVKLNSNPSGTEVLVDFYR